MSPKLSGFPFVIRGFHSDNGSEFINRVVAEMLNKLLIRFTQSWPRHSNDNGLVESKNGSVVRKQLGYAHIPQECATMVNQFHADYLNTYVNFHRPCFFAVSMKDGESTFQSLRTYPYIEVTEVHSFRLILGSEKTLIPSCSPDR